MILFSFFCTGFPDVHIAPFDPHKSPHVRFLIIYFNIKMCLQVQVVEYLIWIGLELVSFYADSFIVCKLQQIENPLCESE